MRYNTKVVGMDCVQMEENKEFQIILRIDNIPKEQFELWKERIFKEMKMEISELE